MRRAHVRLIAVLAAVVAGVALATTDRSAPWSVQGAPPRQPATAVTVIDDFEAPDWPDPDLWQAIVDEDDDRFQWAPRDCRASSGRLSLWAVGGGTAGASMRCRSSYPAGIVSRVALNLDLRPYASAQPLELVFDISADLQTDIGGDFLSVVYRRPDPELELERVPVLEWTGATGPSMQFQTWRVDLLDVRHLYDQGRRWNLAGEQVQFELMLATRRDSSERGEGPHIDRVRLEYAGIAPVIPTPRTPRPTRTSTPTRTLTPTPSPTPTASATPTRTPVDRRKVALPVLYRAGAPPVPTKAADVLVIGTLDEPTTLYRHGGDPAAADVLGALADGPVDVLGYDLASVILARLPRVGDAEGSVRTRYVAVVAGERYVDPVSGSVRIAGETVTNLVQLRVRFQLVDGVRWEDGTPVTADDSVLGRQLACDPETPTDKRLCERTVAYTRIDDHTVEWLGLPGYSEPAFDALFYPPLPRHQPAGDGRRMDQLSARAVLADPVLARRPLAYGPFRVASWTAGDQIVLEANPYYWRQAEGLPYLRQVVFRFFPDLDTLAAAVARGRVDIVLPLDTARLPEGGSSAWASLAPLALVGPDWEHLDFALARGDETVPLAACADLRRAVAAGLDREAIVADVLGARGAVQNGWVPVGHWALGTTSDVASHPHDPAAARALLDGLGFRDADGDGVREAVAPVVCATVDAGGTPGSVSIPAGTRLTLALLTTAGDAVRARTVQRIQADLAAIGVEVRADLIAPETLFARTAEGPLAGRRFDLALVSTRAWVLPPAADYLCRAIPGPSDWTLPNHTGWCDPEHDRQAWAALTALERPASLPAFLAAQRRWSDAFPVVPLSPRLRLGAAAPYVTGIAPDPSSASLTWNVERWAIELPRR